MATAIVLRTYGGPEALTAERVEVGRPGKGELRVRQTAVGVNFHDCYVRSGLYRTLVLPGIPGIEAAGVIEEIGADVLGFAVGDRVAYVTGQYGAYTSERLMPATWALRLPDGIGEAVAATVLLKGRTTEMLTRAALPRGCRIAARVMSACFCSSMLVPSISAGLRPKPWRSSILRAKVAAL